jgi:hypothetical protein
MVILQQSGDKSVITNSKGEKGVQTYTKKNGVVTITTDWGNGKIDTYSRSGNNGNATLTKSSPVTKTKEDVVAERINYLNDQGKPYDFFQDPNTTKEIQQEKINIALNPKSEILRDYQARQDNQRITDVIKQQNNVRTPDGIISSGRVEINPLNNNITWNDVGRYSLFQKTFGNIPDYIKQVGTNVNNNLMPGVGTGIGFVGGFSSVFFKPKETAIGLVKFPYELGKEFVTGDYGMTYQIGNNLATNPEYSIGEFVGQTYAFKTLFASPKLSGVSNIDYEISPKTRTLRSWNPLKFFKDPEWSEQVITPANAEKFRTFNEVIDAVKGARGISQDTAMSQIRNYATSKNIAPEINRQVIKLANENVNVEIGGSSITKNSYLRREAVKMLADNKIDVDTFNSLTQKGDIDILLRESTRERTAFLPKNYELQSENIRAGYRSLIEKNILKKDVIDFNNQNRILDLGAGANPIKTATHYFEFELLTSKDLIKIAKEEYNGKNLPYLKSVLNKYKFGDYNKDLPYPDNYFNKVESKYSLGTGQGKNAYVNTFKVLRPGGELKLELGELPKSVMTNLRKSGFKNIKVKEFKQKDVESSFYKVTANKPKSITNNNINIPDEVYNMDSSYAKFYDSTKGDYLLHKGSITRAIELKQNVVEGKLPVEFYNKYIEKISPKDVMTENAKSIRVIKDIDTEATLKVNKKIASELMQSAIKGDKNLELVQQKVSVGKPVGFNRKIALKVENLPDGTENFNQKVERYFGRKPTTYLSAGESKSFDLVRGVKSDIVKINEDLGYVGNNPKKFNPYIYDIGVGKLGERFVNEFKKKVILTRAGEQVGFIQTARKNTLDALDVDVLQKMAKQEQYLSAKRITGELKGMDKYKDVGYNQNIRNVAGKLWIDIEKDFGKIGKNNVLTPTENMYGAYTFMDETGGHQLQLLRRDLYNLRPEYNSGYYKGKQYANFYKEASQQYLGAIEGGDVNKLLRSKIVTKQIFDSSFYKHLSPVEKFRYKVAAEKLTGDLTPRGWVDYFVNRKKYYQKGLNFGKKEKVNPLDVNNKFGNSELFDTPEQIRSKIINNGEVNFNKLQENVLQNKNNLDKINDIKRITNKEKQLFEVNKLLDSQNFDVMKSLKKSGYMDKDYGYGIKNYPKYGLNYNYSVYKEYYASAYPNYDYNIAKPKQYKKYEYKEYQPVNYNYYSRNNYKYKNSYTNYKQNYNYAGNYPKEINNPYTNYNPKTTITQKNMFKLPSSRNAKNVFKKKNVFSSFKGFYTPSVEGLSFGVRQSKGLNRLGEFTGVGVRGL